MPYDDENIQRLDYQFDINKLKEALNFVLSQADINRMQQLGLTHITGLYNDKWYQSCGSLVNTYVNGLLVKKTFPMTESDFPEIIEEVKSTYFYHVYTTLSTEFKIGRMRIMKLRQWMCLTWHHDTSKRIHIPIISNSGNRIAIDDRCYHLSANGDVYLVNTTNNHSAFNGGAQDRYTLLITLRE